MTIRIVTDSTADMSSSECEMLGVMVIPLNVYFGDESYKDGVTLEPDDFFAKLVNSNVTPKTSQPSPIDFVEIYKTIGQEEPGVEILSIHISEILSGTIQSANLAKSMLGNTDVTVTIYNTKSASAGIATLVREAAKMAGDGHSIAEIIARLDEIRSELSVLFLVDTLEFLKRGGRIGKASALVGTLLNIKPILEVNDEGVVAPLGRVRGQLKAKQYLVDQISQRYGSRQLDITILYSDEREYAEVLGRLLQPAVDAPELRYARIGSVIGTHVGPRACAIVARPLDNG